MNRLVPTRKIDKHTFEMSGYLVHMGTPVVRGGISLKEGVPAEPKQWLRVSSSRLRLSVNAMMMATNGVSLWAGSPCLRFWGVDLDRLIQDGDGSELRKDYPIRIEGGELNHFTGYNAADNGGAATQKISECITRTQLSAHEARIEIEGCLETEGIQDLGDNGARHIVPYFNLLLLIPMELALIETRFSHSLLDRAYDAASAT